MFKKTMLAMLLVVGLSGICLAADSKYVNLVVFDANTNGQVTPNTSKINVYAELIDMNDLAKSMGVTTRDLTIKNIAYHVNSIENVTGTMEQLNPGEFGPNGIPVADNDQGNEFRYLGEYSIYPVNAHNFKGGFVIHFYLSTINTPNTNSTLTASKIITYY